MRNGVTFGIEEGKGPETSFLATTRIWERVLKKSNIVSQDTRKKVLGR
ncbi:uncharacterized protein L3040_005120 [Drepanopeziza brunnea f. sp. 'multigermtubi']|nr:hypothetical protein L3040_005120 [Drepanopeziza brunnea f. sp. 'multigermtubi']